MLDRTLEGVDLTLGGFDRTLGAPGWTLGAPDWTPEVVAERPLLKFICKKGSLDFPGPLDQIKKSN